MADTVAELLVAINGDASGLETAISSVEGQLSVLERKHGNSNTAIKGIDSTNTALKRTESSLKQLESGMAKQKDTTLSYTKSLRESASVFREKKAAVQEAAKSYKTNTAALKENGENLRYQVKLLDGTIATNKERIAGLQSENKYLKRSSAEYKANQSAIKSMRAENTQMRTDRKALTAAIKDNDSALSSETAAYKRAQSEVKKAAADYKKMQSSVAQSKSIEKEYTDAIAETNRQIAEQADTTDRMAQKSQQQVKQTAQQTKEISRAEQWTSSGKAIKEFGEGIDQATKPLQTASLLLAAGGVASAKFAVDFENDFAAVKKTVEGTPEQLAAVKQGIIDLTTTGIGGRSAIPATTVELTELAATAGQLGFAADEVVDFTEVMAQMGSATNLSGETGAQTMARFMNVTKTAHGEVRNLGSTIVYLGNNYETTEAEIASMALRLGRTGTLVGMGAADVLGYSTALSSMGIEAEAGGTAVSKSWTKIDNAVATGGKSLKAFSKVAGKSAEEFSQQWKTDAAGAFNDFLAGLQKADNLPLLLQDLGITEVRESDALKALAIGYDKVKQAVSDANTAWAENTALQKEADAMAQTTAGQLAITKNNIVEAARSIGETMLPTIAKGSTTVKEFAQNINNMSDESKEKLVKTGAAIVGIGAAAKGLASGIKTVGTIAEGVGKIGTSVPILAEIAPTIGAVAAPAAAAAAGIVILDKAFDKLNKTAEEHEQKRVNFAADTVIAAETVKRARNDLAEMKNFASEFQNIQLKINTGDIKGAELETAKARMQEIADLFAEKYHVDLDVDDTNVVTATENVNKLTDAIARQQKKAKAEQDDLYRSIMSGKAEYESSGDRAADYSAQYEYRNSIADGYDRAVDYLEEWAEKYDDIKSRSYSSKKAMQKDIDDLASDYKQLFDDNGLSKYQNLYGSDFTNELEDAKDQLKEWRDLANESGTANDAIIKNADQYKESMNSFLSGELDTLAKSAQAGEDYSRSLEKIGNVAKILDLESFNGNQSILAEWAITAASAQNNIEGFTQAVTMGSDAVKALTTDSLADMTDWGISAERSAQYVAEAMTTAGVSAADTVSIINSAFDNLGITEIKVKVNPDTGEIEAYEPEDKEFTVTANGEDNGVSDLKDTVDDTNGKDIKVTGTGVDNGVSSLKSMIDGIQSKTVTITAKYSVFGSLPTSGGTTTRLLAGGTQNFPGGLAMVNDQKGVPDPRELVIDRGKAFIPEGRDVILPLSKGAKVYTAKQTREIMNNLGIPRYAGGKDNSDAFTTARDDWTHYTKNHAVGTAEELKKWVEFSKQFTDNMEDVKDIEEEIYSLTRKQREEMNDQSNQYLENLAYMDRWEELGDNDYAAWQRVEARNREALQSDKITTEEYYDTINTAGKTILDNRKKQSLQLLEHERKYNGLATEDYIAGLKQVQQFTQEYYDSGLIDLRTFYDSKLEIDEKYLDAEQELVQEQKDAAQERVDAYFKSADNWKTIRDTFDDWEDFDDNYERYYTARLAHVEELYRNNDLDPEEYMDRSMDEYLNLYKAAKDRLDEELSDYRKEIDETEQKFRDEEQALRDSWTVQDRDEDIDEVNRLLDIYKNASTEAGQQKYKDLLDQKKQLERDEELYQLQQDNNAVLETMEAEYTRREEENKKQLKDLRTDTFNIFSKADSIDIDTSQISELVGTLSKSAETSAHNTQTAINRVIDLLSTIANKKSSSSSYTNNSRVTIAGASENTVRGIINGTIITGLGDVMF